MDAKTIADYLISNRTNTRVRHGRACPVCGRTDWCLSTEDGSAALCRRADGVGSVKEYGEYGHLYILNGAMDANALPPIPKTQRRSDEEMHAIWLPRAAYWSQNTSQNGRLSEQLHVSVESLRELRVGWDGRAWTFPERNAGGLIVGVSRRFDDGSKRCARGSRRGLTYGDSWAGVEGPAFIAEGGSDVAAGITMGLSVIGRPSNSGGVDMLAKLLGGHRERKRIVVIGERDRKSDGRWPGMVDGAQKVASKLSLRLNRNVSCRLLPDNAKDLRSWWISQSLETDRGRIAGKKLLECIRERPEKVRYV